MKKLFRIFCMVVLILVIGVGVFVWTLSRTPGGLENWIGKQLQVVANSYLIPTLSFDKLHYQYPGTVTLTNLRLTAQDPTHPGQTVDILGSESATISLAEIPSVGKPLMINQIVLDKPLFQAIAAEPGKPDLVGFNNLIRTDAIEAATQPDATPDRKLSQIFQMKMIRLNDGRIVYDPRIAGTQPMTLDHINTQLDITPAAAGVYDLKLGLNRKPLFDLDTAGRFNIDTLTFSNMAIHLTGSVGRGKDDYLPPQLQEILNKYQIKGDLDIQVAGQMPILDFRKGKVDLNAELTNAYLTAGDLKLPVQRIGIESHLQDGKIVVPIFKVDALKGTADCNGIVTLNDTYDSDLYFHVRNMVIDELFVKPGTAEQPKLGGRVNANIHGAVPMTCLIASLNAQPPATNPSSTQPLLLSVAMPEKWGAGEIHLDHGRLVNLPVIDQFSDVVTSAFSLVTRKRPNEETEKADANFIFAGDQINCVALDYHGDFLNAHGDGVIKLDKRLDLTINAGKSSNLVTLLTDQLLTYRVLGTIDKPKIESQTVVGSVADKAGGAVGSGAKETGKGIKSAWEWLFGGEK